MLAAVSRAYLLAQLNQDSGSLKSCGMNAWFFFGDKGEGVKILVPKLDQKHQPHGPRGFTWRAASPMEPALVGGVP